MSQKSGVKLAFCMGLNFDSVPHICQNCSTLTKVRKIIDIAFPSLVKYTPIYSLFPVPCSLFPKTKKLCTSLAWEWLYILDDIFNAPPLINIARV